MSDAWLTSKGRVTIPVAIRRAMGLRTGERVIFTVLHDGTTVLRNSACSIEKRKGSFAPAPGVRKLTDGSARIRTR